jgi:hypothetical protein
MQASERLQTVLARNVMIEQAERVGLLPKLHDRRFAVANNDGTWQALTGKCLAQPLGQQLIMRYEENRLPIHGTATVYHAGSSRQRLDSGKYDGIEIGAQYNSVA